MKNKNILITGGCGFIGCNLVRHLVNKYPSYNIYNLDSLTYAGKISNLKDIASSPNYFFINEDITNDKFILDLFLKHNFDGVIHLAAESHVDRSISNPSIFAKTNVLGTLNLLNATRNSWLNNYDNKIFYHISTDEVYGSLGNTGFFTEKTPYDPRSPYSASKASSDHFVRAFGETYGLPFIISNCSNNYGPFQDDEKLIPLMIKNIVHQKQLPIYGDGKNIRDWLYVQDHVEAIDLIFHSNKINETYNIGGLNEWTNIKLINFLIDSIDEKLDRPKGFSKKLITFVDDRLGHDLRYAIDASKILNDLNWKPKNDFSEGIEKTIKWYLNKLL